MSKDRDGTVQAVVGAQEGIQDRVKEHSDAEEIERLKRELASEHQFYLRTLADFNNYRRRVQHRDTINSMAWKRDIIMELIKLLDRFERALTLVNNPTSNQQIDSYIEQTRAIYQEMNRLLEAQGVVSYDSVGQRFDPHLHEAVGSIESQQYAPGTVARQLQKGYLWNNHLIRPAQVQVAQSSSR